MMKAPSFWWGKIGVRASLLTPLGWLYGRIVRTVMAETKPQHVPVPVISIGNVVVGGAGKTPTTIALAKLLQSMGETPHILTRGYGNSAQSDEAQLLKDVAPTWVNPNRWVAASQAIEAGATVLLLDDGHQHHTLHKDLSLLVVDGLQGIGNGLVMPAGPLRETLQDSLTRTDGVILIDGKNLPFTTTLPIFHATISPINAPNPAQSYIAFCGIGMPDKFFNLLEKMNLPIVARHIFADHHPYTTHDLDKLCAHARSLGATLITTRKDWVRITKKYQDTLQVLDITLSFDHNEEIVVMLRHVMDKKRQSLHD